MRAIQRRGAVPIPLVLALCLLASVAASCAGSDEGQRGAADIKGKPQTGLKTAVLRSGSVELKVELALSSSEQSTGMMFRTEAPDGRGMLFVYPDDRRMSFWMKNTLVPLSIAFLGSDGVIKEIRDMEARSLEAIESERYARYALEVPLGWFSRAGLKVGDVFDLSALASAR